MAVARLSEAAATANIGARLVTPAQPLDTGHLQEYLRSVLGNGMRVRQVPKLVFVADPSIETGNRIEQILAEGGRRTDTLDDDWGDALGHR